MQKMGYWLIVWLILTCLIGLIDAQENAYTSVESIKIALILDRKISSFLRQSLKDLDEYRELVQQYLDEQGTMENAVKTAFPDKKHDNMDGSKMNSVLAGDPLIAFQTIRRIAVDVHRLSTRLNSLADGLNDLVEDDVKNNSNVKVTYKEDLLGAAKGILRLQSTYRMTASDLIDGKILHLNTSSKLTVSDCLLLAQAARNKDALDYYAEWREQADHLCKKMDSGYPRTGGCSRVTEPLLMEAMLEHDEIRSAYLKKLEEDPSYYTESRVFPKKLQQFSATKQRMIINKRKIHGSKNLNAWCSSSNEMLDEHERSQLFCHYLKNPKDPFATLQRFKMEVRSRTPLITTIHNAISGEEADFLQELAKPLLTRSMVVGEGEYAEDMVSEHRISQTGWLVDQGRLGTISKRIERITGLATDGDNSELFQVVNYGIGGLFSQHFDALDSAEEFERRLNESDYMGNRMMTFLIYLSDVELGGATYFPKANVSVYPKKGSATMWYNLDDSGNNDGMSLHGGCPVLYGSKWIANKWILERGQLFRKPCLAKTPP